MIWCLCEKKERERKNIIRQFDSVSLCFENYKSNKTYYQVLEEQVLQLLKEKVDYS